MPNEKALKRKLVERLKLIKGLWYYCPSDRFTAGVPDVLVLYKGKFFGIELKDPEKPSNTHRKLQKFVRDIINKAGGYAEEFDNVIEAINFILEATRCR